MGKRSPCAWARIAPAVERPIGRGHHETIVGTERRAASDVSEVRSVPTEAPRVDIHELLRRLEPLVERVGDLQRVGVHDGDRVERRALLVVGVDAIQVALDERMAGERARAHGGVHVGDRRFVDAEGTLGVRDGRAGGEQRDGE